MLSDDTGLDAETPSTTLASRAEHLLLAMTTVDASTAACAAHGDARMFAVLSDYYALVAKATRPVGGHVIKVMGDGTLLTFPVDHVREAVDALRSLQSEASTLWRRFDERCHVKVKVGVGVVTCGMLGPPGEERFDIVGDALNQLFKAPWGDFQLMPEVAALLR